MQASRYQAGVGWETGNLVTIHPGAPGATCPSVAAQFSPTGQALVGYVMRRSGEPDRVYAHMATASQRAGFPFEVASD